MWLPLGQKLRVHKDFEMVLNIESTSGHTSTRPALRSKERGNTVYWLKSFDYLALFPAEWCDLAEGEWPLGVGHVALAKSVMMITGIEVPALEYLDDCCVPDNIACAWSLSRRDGGGEVASGFRFPVVSPIPARNALKQSQQTVEVLENASLFPLTVFELIGIGDLLLFGQAKDSHAAGISLRWFQDPDSRHGRVLAGRFPVFSGQLSELTIADSLCVEILEEFVYVDF